MGNGKKSDLGLSDVYLETVQKQTQERRTALKLNDTTTIVKDLRHDKRSSVHEKEGALVKKIDLRDANTFFPEGYEKAFLGFYIIFLPYLAGLAFLFFYVGGGNFDLFHPVLEKHSYILTWCIGYEILAVLTLVYIIKNAIVISLRVKSSPATQKVFRKP